MDRKPRTLHWLATLAAAFSCADSDAARPSSGKVFFAEHHFFQSRINAVSADGSDAETLFTPVFPTYLPWDVAVDPKLGRIFWMYTTSVGHGILSANMDGSEEEAGPSMIQGIGLAIDRVNHNLIWADNLGGCCGNGAIYSTNLLSGQFTVLSPDLGLGVSQPITTAPRPDPLGHDVYFGRGFQLFRIAAEGGKAELMVPDAIKHSFSVAADPNRDALYRLEAHHDRAGAIVGSITRSGLDGSRATVILADIHGGDLHLDHVMQRLYWVDVRSNSIMSATVDGADLRTIYTAPSPWTLSGIDVVPAEQPPDPADLTGDGVVNGLDLALLLGNWGACLDPTPGRGPAPRGDECGAADLDDNGIVNGLDIALLLASWS